MAGTGPADAFGYRDAGNVIPLGEYTLQVSEGKQTDTLEPIVILYLRHPLDADQVGLQLTPDGAEGLAEELNRWADRAREKSLNPPTG